MTVLDLEPVDSPAPESSIGRRRSIELAVVLGFLVPRLALSFFSTPSANTPFTLSAIGGVLTDLGLVGLVWYLVWAGGERVADVGLQRPRLREVGLGLLLAYPIWELTMFLQRTFQHVGLSSPPAHSLIAAPAGASAAVLGVALVSVIAVTEEFVFRGYLLTRLRQVGAPTWVAATTSVIVFTLGHGYEGMAAFLAIGCFAVILTGLVLWRRSLTTAIVVHLVFDLISIVILPAILR
jgi:membrane protease YdiL (CAAX protease family)